ncbi:MAG: dCMP deaminase family protein [Deltaproteobacteria bacterium]|jgi:dCMP deaminase|nr:dCMP deaminase family protein [Deltaproteobacteria bacterium]
MTEFTIPSPLEGRLIDRPDWNQYFMAIAKVVSTRSTCSSRPVGCVIAVGNRILATGYNGAPPGATHCTDLGRDGRIYCARRANNVPDDLKLQAGCHSLHAEENAIDLAHRFGVADLLPGSTLYSTLSPCIRCIGKLKRNGVARVYYELAYESVNRERDEDWARVARESFEVYERLSIEGQEAKKIAGALLGLTSERLLPSG